MTGITLTLPGEKTKIAGSGTEIPLESLDFSQNGEIDGLEMAASYVNSDGDWAYALSCPVIDHDNYIGDLIAEYEWDHIDQSLPASLYEEDSSFLLLDNLSGKTVVQQEKSSSIFFCRGDHAGMLLLCRTYICWIQCQGKKGTEKAGCRKRCLQSAAAESSGQSEESKCS